MVEKLPAVKKNLEITANNELSFVNILKQKKN